ncbi:HNH endonuclease signature motif containing protein, partial [Microbispora bryophytorum]|uniref:HNH endonuclease signature motif containing protein n=1 Tax=Microbispora bryophytorum TaxID=1460882 RepID=UPI001CC28E2D
SRAPAWTVGQLIEHIQRLVLAIDPDWAEKRYREAVRRRRVVGARTEEGTATVSGLDLPLDRAVAGCERIDELARACKRAGDRRPVDHIRADLFLGSLDGSFESLSDSEIVTHVRTHPFLDATPSDASADTPDLQPADNTTTDTDTATKPATASDDTATNTTAEPAAAFGDAATAASDGTAADTTTDTDTATEPAAKSGGARSSGTRSRTRPEARSGTGSTGTGTFGQARDGDLPQDRPDSHTGDHTAHAGDHADDPAGVPVGDHADRADDASDGETRDHDESAPADISNGPPRQEGVDGHAGDRARDIADKTADKTADKAVGRAADRAADEAVDKTVDKTVDEAADDSETALADTRAGGGDGDDSAKPSPVSPLAADAWPTQTRPAQAWSVQAWSVRAWSVREIRVELTTLLGLDEHPAHLPGWGMVHAAQARRIVASMLTGQWRFAVCTDNGHLLLTGITGRRPCPPTQRPARDTRRGGIVELQITLTRLRELAATSTATGAWAPLIADLARHTQHTETRQPQNGRPHTHPPDAAQPTPSSESGESAQSVQSGESTESKSGESGGSAWSAEPESEESAGRRHAGVALRRYVQIRGRVCSWPGCRMPATRTDQDHIHPWADNGATTADNLHLACRHDHRARHIGGWRVTSAGPQLIVWTSPLGHAYPSPLPRIIQPAPDPQPRNWPDAPPERLPANPAGTPDTIMTPSRPQTTPSRTGGRHDTTSGEPDSQAQARPGTRRGAGHSAGHGAGHGASEQADTETGGASFKDDREVPPF